MKNHTELLLATPSMFQSRDLLIHVLEAYFIFVSFCSFCKETEVWIGLDIFLLLQNMFLYGLNLRIKL